MVGYSFIFVICVIIVLSNATCNIQSVHIYLYYPIGLLGSSAKEKKKKTVKRGKICKLVKRGKEKTQGKKCEKRKKKFKRKENKKGKKEVLC